MTDPWSKLNGVSNGGMKTFVVIDGYTLAIETSDAGVCFSGYNSRCALTHYDDSNLIEFLASKAQDDAFWHCLQSHGIYEEGNSRCFVMTGQQVIADPHWMLSASYQNWAVWELLNQQRQCDGELADQLFCLWHPGSYYRMFGMPYCTALKIRTVVREWSEWPSIQLDGVDLLNEAQWNARFAASSGLCPARPLLVPRILSELEQAASLYLLFFDDRAQLYAPDAIEGVRYDLLNQLAIANLLNRDITADLRDRLSLYPHLQRCVLQAETLWRYMNCTRSSLIHGKVDLGLDWLLFDPVYPAADSEFHRLCLQHFRQANLQYPYTIPFEAYGQRYRLVTGYLYAKHIILLQVIEIRSAVDAIASFVSVEQPTYLELVAWASREESRPPMAEWELVVDWKGREEELANVGTDPTLPQAAFFLNSLASHVARLWQNGDRSALKRGLNRLRYHYAPEARYLSARGQMLLSGKLPFNHGDWFENGFLRLYRRERGGRTGDGA